MSINVLFFARYAEVVGFDSLEMEGDFATVDAVRARATVGEVSDALEWQKDDAQKRRDVDRERGLQAMACLIRNGADVMDKPCALTGRGVLERAKVLGLPDVVKLIEEMLISRG